MSWHLSVALYDVAQHSAIQDESESSYSECTSETEPKEACAERIRDLQFIELASRLLSKLGQGKEEGPKYYTFTRGLAQGAFGGFAVTGLIAGSAVTHVNAQHFAITEADGSKTPITPHLDTYADASFGIMGVGLAGSLGTAIWGLWSKQDTSSRADRLRYLKGLLLGASGSMLASSLIAASSLQANDGKNCVQNRSNVTCTFYPDPGALAGE